MTNLTEQDREDIKNTTLTVFEIAKKYNITYLSALNAKTGQKRSTFNKGERETIQKSPLSTKELAILYNVKEQTIYNIRNPKTPVWLTKEQKQYIIKSKKPVKELALMYGIHEESVRKIIGKKKRKVFNSDDIDYIKTSQKTCKELSNIFKVSKATIRNVLKNHNIKLFKKTRRTKTPNNANDIVIFEYNIGPFKNPWNDKILSEVADAIIKSDKSINELSRIFDISEKMVLNIIMTYNKPKKYNTTYKMLTDDEKKEIIDSPLSYDELAKRFNVSLSRIYSVKNSVMASECKITQPHEVIYQWPSDINIEEEIAWIWKNCPTTFLELHHLYYKNGNIKGYIFKGFTDEDIKKYKKYRPDIDICNITKWPLKSHNVKRVSLKRY